MARVVTSEDIAVWRPRVEEIARRFGNRSTEFDDRVQVGLISVWVALGKGVHPTDQMIRNSMRMLGRTLRRQRFGTTTSTETVRDELDQLAVRADGGR